MKAIAMFSGGKDSTYAIHRAFELGIDVDLLVTVVPQNPYSWMFHRPLIELTSLQAESMGLKHVYIDVSGEKEIEVVELLEKLRGLVKHDYKYVIVGAIRSNYQRKRFEYVASKLGLKLFAPFWMEDSARHIIEVVERGIEFIISSITSYGIPMNFLGEVIDLQKALKLIELSKKYGFDPSFEGGEAETFVIYAPLFRYRICLELEKEIVSEFEGYVKPRNWRYC